MTVLDRGEWARMREMPAAGLLSELSAMELPARMSAELPGLRWSLHPQVRLSGDCPGPLLVGGLRFGNGYSATAVFGAEPEPAWGEGPWFLGGGLAAKRGDEARGELAACFAKGDPLAACAVDPQGFGEDFEEVAQAGDWERSPLAESRDGARLAAAARMVERLPPCWDEPCQAGLWAAARAGDAAALARGLCAHPQWARRRWSKGSSLLALCARMGRWESARAVKEASGEGCAGELRDECSKALAGLCMDDSPEGAAGASARRALLRAWGCGIELGEQAWRMAFGPAPGAAVAAARAWREAEAQWLGAGAGAVGGGGCRRI